MSQIVITIVQKSNGYEYVIRGCPKDNGEFVAKNTEEFKMLEDIGKAIVGHNITVTRR